MCDFLHSHEVNNTNTAESYSDFISLFSVGSGSVDAFEFRCAWTCLYIYASVFICVVELRIDIHSLQTSLETH